MASIDETVSSQVAEYLLQRASLIAEEKEQRHDYAFRQRLSPTAKRAASIVQHIRAHEAATVWTKEVEDDEGDVYPGMMFTLAKDRMEGTRLWKIVKRMPKGCLLHSHLEAMVDMSWLLNLALETPGMYLFSDTPLSSPAALQSASIQFVYSAPTPYPVDIYSPSYPSGTLVSMVSAAESFPFPSGDDTLPPTERFLLWLTARTTVTAAESLKHHEGINQIWRKFQSIFSIIQGIIYYEPIYREFVRHILHHLHLDQVLWVDLRIAFVMTLRAADTGELLPRSDVVRIFEEEVRRYKESPEGRGFWGARVIWTTIRIFESAAVRESMQECIDAAKKYPSVIAGFDLVGQEDLGRPQLEHVPDLLWFRSTCASLNLTLPFYFHAGETLGDGTSTDNNLFDALLLGSVRIGHGFSLYKHPLLLRLCRERNICVEVCPVSNEILRLTSSICSHPLPALLAHGVPVALCNDDPGLLGTAGVTHDFWQVVQAFDNVGLEGAGDLAETSVKFAAFEREGERERRMGEWRGSWERFCEWVVVNFGEWEEDGEGVGEVVVLA